MESTLVLLKHQRYHQHHLQHLYSYIVDNTYIAVYNVFLTEHVFLLKLYVSSESYFNAISNARRTKEQS